MCIKYFKYGIDKKKVVKCNEKKIQDMNGKKLIKEYKMKV